MIGTSILIVLAVLNAILLIFLLTRVSRKNEDAINKYEEANKNLRDELRNGREEANKTSRDLREEIANNIKATTDTLVSNVTGIGQLQQNQLVGMTKQLRDITESNQASLEAIRCTLDAKVKDLQENNEKKLDEMRSTVDEKLHSTLERRLGESFKLVSDRLEAVQRGLGEMQNLAVGVGDLKRVLTNVKARGTWAEVQLGAILEQILTPEQFERNVPTKENSREIVEFAIKLPGSKNDPHSCVWLPIDSKFPKEDYDRIQEAAEKGDPESVQKATEALYRAVKIAAQEIHDKHVNPPLTTDFAVMFLGTEGLYSEILRNPGLVEKIQRDYRIMIAGPTVLSALLSSLRLGFQTLAIEKSAAEVWKLLAAVRTEFGKFEMVLGKVKKQLDTATKTIEQTEVRTRAIERKLASVDKMPLSDASNLLDVSLEISDEDLSQPVEKSDEDLPF